MEEQGIFRTSMRGFNREDVLSYIDRLQSEQSAALQEQSDAAAKAAEEAQKLREQVAALSEQLSAVQAENASLFGNLSELERLVDEHNRTNRALREQAAAAAGARERLLQTEKELHSLREQAASVSSVRARLAATEKELTELRHLQHERSDRLHDVTSLNRQLNDQLAACKQQLAMSQQQVAALKRRGDQLEESNARYQAVAGNVSELAAELRTLGNRFLEIACKRSEECLEAMDIAVNTLERQLSESHAQMGQARELLCEQSEAAGLRLEELVQALEHSGAAGGSDTPETCQTSDFFR